MTDPCWYCGRPSAILCDHVVGSEQVPPGCTTSGCPNPAEVLVGASEPVAVCSACAVSPVHRRKRTRVPFDPNARQPVTCDAAACWACARRFGWKQVFSAIVCTRSGRSRGCHSASLHRCHVHARAEEIAVQAPTGDELRGICAALAAVSSTATSSPRTWRRNDALFLAELREGRRWQEWAAGELQLRGLRVEVPEPSERASIADADRWTREDCDIIVRNSAVGDCVLEVKSRDMHFLDPAGYPHPTALVDTVDGWEAKQTPPRAVLLVSRPARRILVVSAATKPRWRRETRRDRVRNTAAEFYECPRELLCSLEWLVNKLLP